MPRGITRRTATALLVAAVAAPAMAAAPKPLPRVPSHGFALPDWLAAEPRRPSPPTLDRLAGLGFETIRLPIDPALAIADFAPTVAGALQAALEHGFSVVLDLHPAGDVDPDQLNDAWALLAPIVAASPPERVFAELLNEPPLDPAAWSRLAARLAATIRSAAPDHALIWGPARLQGIWELSSQHPPADGNLIAAVHYYTPMGFTHQGETWDRSPLARLRNLPFPATRDSPQVEALAAVLSTDDRRFLDAEFAGRWDDAQIAADFARLGQWAKHNGLPVLLGEFGVLDFAVDPASRSHWIRSVRRAAEAVGAGWIYWEADHGFGFMADRTDASSIDPDIVGALLS